MVGLAFSRTVPVRADTKPALLASAHATAAAIAASICALETVTTAPLGKASGTIRRLASITCDAVKATGYEIVIATVNVQVAPEALVPSDSTLRLSKGAVTVVALSAVPASMPHSAHAKLAWAEPKAATQVIV